MSEFEQDTYQSVENEQYNEQQSVDQPQEQGTVESPPQESNYFTVKYNKEDIDVPYEQAPDYIQKGMNYDKVQQRASEYEQHLNRVAQASGYQNHDELLQAVEEYELLQERQRYEEAGVNPDALKDILDNHPDVQFARDLKARQEEEMNFKREADELWSEFPELTPDDIPQDVWNLKEQKGLSLLDAYLRHNYKTLAQQQEQQAIQKIQQNQFSSPGSLNNGDVSHKVNVSTMPSTDFNSLVDSVLRGEKRTL